MNQLVFKFPFKVKYFKQDFYVSSNNFSAYKLIESWPNWPGKWLNVFGMSGSGKTHLSKILEKKINKIKLVEAKYLNNKMNPLFYSLYTVFQRDHIRQYKKKYGESDDSNDSNDSDDYNLPQCLKYVIIGFVICIVILIFV